MSVDQRTRQPLAPFVPGALGAAHLATHHGIDAAWTEIDDVALLGQIWQADKHAHKHANGLADHRHTDQPEVTA